jgi:tetratricopeptide (TPR) repeat protein
MFKHSRLFIVFLAVAFVFPSAHAQGPSKPDIKPDYSKEAFVVEHTSTRIVFENDGTGTRESEARIRIQSEAGVQRYGLLALSYQSSTESLDIDYVRVQKPDGTVVPTPAENTQDMAAEITRQAPFYSDLREKHVAVKGLSVGDSLEFHAHWHTTKPLAPGQFWYAYNFSHDGIILQEQLQISVPRDRPVKWKSPDVKPAITEVGARRVFVWIGSQLEHKSSDQEKSEQETTLYQTARGQLPLADVQISSFQSWEEVGRWYGGLQQERVKPTPEILAKASELTKGASDDNAKLRAIYKYVSTEFRYIGIAFGIGRYQPHEAAEVLSNQYGDCKDKHTLLASLLDAAGIKAYPALISSSHEIDQDVPSPGQFDHVISVVPQGSGFLWLDTTTEVAPFAYLVTPLRDKHALVMPQDKPILMTTPADPPSKASQTFKIEAKLDDTGTLTGKVERTVQGDDSEVLLRSAFRRVPMPQWKELIQQISYGSGFSGDVSEVTAGSPEKTDEPFRFSYQYVRKDYSSWSTRQIDSPLPVIALPNYDVKPSHPVWLGAPAEAHFESRVELPKGYTPKLPRPVHIKRDFADYDAVYAVKDGVFAADRHVVVKVWEVPLSDYEEYKKFRKAVDDDYGTQTVLLSGNSARTSSYQDEIWTLPYSDNAEAAHAYDQAREGYQKHDPQAEIASLEHAVEIDPDFTRAWLWLGEIYKSMQQPDAALRAYRRAVDVDQQPVSYKALGVMLMGMRKFEDAITVWQELIKIAPDSVDGPSQLARTYFNLKRYAEAASALEAAVKLDSQSTELCARLGTAYLRSGNDDKALAAYKQALELDPSPLMLNDIGYELADASKKLPQALEYAEKAVHQEEEASQKVKLSDLRLEDLAHTASLGAYWDTLGWAYFRAGNLDQAEKYVNAAWKLSQDWEQADHLGQIYEKRGKSQGAIHAYQLALAVSTGKVGATDNLAETRARVERLRSGSSEFGALFNATNELSTIRTFKLARLTPGTASAEYFLLFGPGSKVDDVKFISGSVELESAVKVIPTIPFNVVLPDDGPTRLLRRAMIACSSVSGCNLVLFIPGSVHSVN